jgi:hypothetical protein
VSSPQASPSSSSASSSMARSWPTAPPPPRASSCRLLTDSIQPGSAGPPELPAAASSSLGTRRRAQEGVSSPPRIDRGWNPSSPIGGISPQGAPGSANRRPPDWGSRDSDGGLSLSPSSASESRGFVARENFFNCFYVSTRACLLCYFLRFAPSPPPSRPSLLSGGGERG